MKLTEKLLDFLHSAFDKSPRSFVALRVRHASDAFRWQVADDVLVGWLGDEQIFFVALAGRTIRSLIDHLSTLTQVSVVYADPSALDLSATILIDGVGAQAENNGDCLYAYSSVLWSWLHSVGVELSAARVAVDAAVDQMSIVTADADWLDEWGGYFGVPRMDGEADVAYANRIIVEVMRARGNNKAIEQSLFERFGQASSVNDVVRWKNATQTHNSAFNYTGIKKYDAVQDPLYGLFEVEIGYDLESGADLLVFASQVRAFIEQFRDAGTHLDSLRLSGSQLSDVATPPTEEGTTQPVVVQALSDDALIAPSESLAAMPAALAALGDTLTAPADGAATDVSYSTSYVGIRSYNGIVKHQGGLTVAEPL